MQILIAEDDTNLRRGLSELLQLEGYDVITAECGLSAVELFKTRSPDFCILDVSMPGLDGFETCKAIRQLDQKVPIIFLTARNEEINRLLGFGLGADDYVGKPFGSQELIARISAILRRTSSEQSTKPDDDVFVMGDLRVDARAMRAYRSETGIALSPKEISVLRLLHNQAGLAVTRDALYDRCWGREHYPNSRALDQFISNLRRKIETDPASPRIITTVHGAGYRFDPNT